MSTALRFSRGSHVLVDGDMMKATKSRLATDHLWLRGTAKATAHYLQIVRVAERARVVANCCRDVRATDDAYVEAREWTIVYAFGRAQVLAKDHTIIFAYDDAQVTAQDRALVILEGANGKGQPNGAQVRVIGRRVVVVGRRNRAGLVVSTPPFPLDSSLRP